MALSDKELDALEQMYDEAHHAAISEAIKRLRKLTKLEVAVLFVHYQTSRPDAAAFWNKDKGANAKRCAREYSKEDMLTEIADLVADELHLLP